MLIFSNSNSKLSAQHEDGFLDSGDERTNSDDMVEIHSTQSAILEKSPPLLPKSVNFADLDDTNEALIEMVHKPV